MFILTILFLPVLATLLLVGAWLVFNGTCSTNRLYYAVFVLNMSFRIRETSSKPPNSLLPP